MDIRNKENVQFIDKLTRLNCRINTVISYVGIFYDNLIRFGFQNKI